MTGYTNRQLVENFLQRDLTENEIALLPVLIPAAKLWIDRQTSSQFDEVAATTRYYEGGTADLDIEPYTDLTEIKAINDDGSDSLVYDLTVTPAVIQEPQNETVKREIRKRNGSFPTGQNRISVTAKFSEWDDGVPEDISIAATRIVGGMINAGKLAGTGENVIKESLEGHTIEYNQINNSAQTLLATDPVLASIIGARKDLMIW